MPIHQCKLFNYRMPPRILQHIQWCQLQFTMWLSILRRSVWGCLLLLQEGLPPRLRVSCDQWVPIWYSASLILVKFFCVLIFALITLLYSVDRNYVKKYVLLAYGFKVFTNWLYQPVYLFEQLYVKCMFQGTKGTIQKTSAIHYLSTAFHTGKWLYNDF